jgi:hypothetical protein
MRGIEWAPFAPGRLAPSFAAIVVTPWAGVKRGGSRLAAGFAAARGLSRIPGRLP